MSRTAHRVLCRLSVGYPVQERITSRLLAAWLPVAQQSSTMVSQGRLVSVGGLLIVLFLSGSSATLLAQETASAGLSNLPLHQPPQAASVQTPGSVQTPSPQAVPQQSPASIAVTVRDTEGAQVSGVHVTLVGQNNAIDGVETPSSKGVFTFSELSPGAYQVKINAAGLEPYVSGEVLLAAGERRELPLVVMRLPTKKTTVEVAATLNEVAQAEVKQQEQQRVLGFLPNYYTSYIWNAAPMTPKLKMKLGLRMATDPVTFLVAAGIAGAEQSHNTFPGYGRGAQGYAKRYGATYADALALRMLGSAILPAVFHQDPRYFYLGSGTTRSRVLHALAATLIRRGDDGQLQPNYSQLLGNFAAAGISNLYRAPGDRTAGLTLRNGLIITGSGAVENLLREFLSRKLTPNVPAFANGKP